MAVRYTRELLEETARGAARGATSFDDAVSWCGGTPTPGSRRYLRAKMTEAETNTAHFTTAGVRHTAEVLRAPVTPSPHGAAAVRRPRIDLAGGSPRQIGDFTAELRFEDRLSASQSGPPSRRPIQTWGENRV